MIVNKDRMIYSLTLLSVLVLDACVLQGYTCCWCGKWVIHHIISVVTRGLRTTSRDLDFRRSPQRHRRWLLWTPWRTDGDVGGEEWMVSDGRDVGKSITTTQGSESSRGDVDLQRDWAAWERWSSEYNCAAAWLFSVREQRQSCWRRRNIWFDKKWQPSSLKTARGRRQRFLLHRTTRRAKCLGSRSVGDGGGRETTGALWSPKLQVQSGHLWRRLLNSRLPTLTGPTSENPEWLMRLDWGSSGEESCYVDFQEAPGVQF